jgi:hypothetical protein
MNYLPEEALKNETVLLEMMGNSEVSRFLRSKGYQTIFVSSSFDFKGIEKYLQVLPPGRSVVGMRVSSLAYWLVRNTALAPFDSLLTDHGRKAILDAFDVLAKIPDYNEPTFVFAHIMAPHPPFIFDRDGNPLKVSILEGPMGWETKDSGRRYLEQLLFVNHKTRELVNEILAKPGVKPIIILQADHGPKLVGKRDTPELTEKIKMNETMNILNAYYLPGKDKSVLYEAITPVNTFRTVFNLYFGTSYERLKDVSYYYSSSSDKYIIITPQD